MKNYMGGGKENLLTRLASLFLFGFACFIPLVFSSCSDSLEEKAPSVQYGALEIASGNERALEIGKIEFAEVRVTGTGIGAYIGNDVSVSGGAGAIQVDGIPAGKNRVVTVYAKDSSKSTIYGVTMRAAVDIEAGKTTSVSVNWGTTALGNVFNKLNTLDVDLQNVDSSQILSCIDTSKHALLIDAARIASDYKSNSLKAAANYVMTPATARVNFTQGNGAFKVQVCDPSSAVSSGTNGVTEIKNIVPGTWDVILLDASGNEIKRKTLSEFTSGGTVEIDMNDKVWTDIVVHAKYTHIWAWEKNGESGNLFAAWPGEKMTEETGGWYGYEIKDASSLKIIFSNAGGGQTGDLDVAKPGEYWYLNGKLYEGNPEDTQKPVLTSFVADKTGAVSNNVVFTISATDNSGLSKAEIFVDGKSVASVALSGTKASTTYTWNSAAYKNGSHTVSVVVFDGAGNASDEKSLLFTTSNTNLPPVAVISGSSSAVVSGSKTYSASSSYDQTIGGQIKSYSWTVTGGATPASGSGETITLTMPSSEKSITIKLVVTDDEGATDETTKEVKVKEKAESIDFREESIYFLMTTRFYDGDKSNNVYCWDGPDSNKTNNDPEWRGDFEGLIQKLDYIKALGFSAIWITPIVQNASGYDYHGYHAYDFSQIDERYATSSYTAEQSFQRLLDEAHKKGMKIVLDIVINHTGNWGEKNIYPMFKMADKVNSSTGYPVSKVMEVDDKYGYLAKGAKIEGGEYSGLKPGNQYNARINAMKTDSIDTDLIYHHCGSLSWQGYECQLGQIAGDCVDLNTENPIVQKYLIECYQNYITMGVDAFRIDTVKHVNRLMFNEVYIPGFKEAGGENFYSFGEVCARYRGRWNEGVPSLSPSFYTWKDTENYSLGTEALNTAATAKNFATYASNFNPPAPSICNARLDKNDYHAVDYSMRSGLDVIDFPMHWAFASASDAFNVAKEFDTDYCDATWNVTYVDSHDYAPDSAPESQRFAGYWPDKLNLLFTFRGIPCIYYGSEIEFKKGKPIDVGPNAALEDTGRAYFGDYLEGTVTARDFGVYDASGTVKETLNHSLAQQIIALNKIRRAVPALQKGQYATDGCNGGISFKRRYTDSSNGIDSYVLVAINGQATFSNVLGGTYTELVTGKTISSSGSLTSDSIGEGNMRVYVWNYLGESGFKGGTLQ